MCAYYEHLIQLDTEIAAGRRHSPKSKVKFYDSNHMSKVSFHETFTGFSCPEVSEPSFQESKGGRNSR